MQGDKCLFKYTNEYRTNWIVGIIQNINNNLATIHLPDLRQRLVSIIRIILNTINNILSISHCVTLDNVKPFNSDMPNSNHFHNVQKLVQPINSQFALIFSNSS